jgi:dienelactone hydrolase
MINRVIQSLAGVILGLFLSITTTGAATGEPPAISRFTTSTGVEYGIWGQVSTNPAPILFVLAGTIESTLIKPYFRQAGNELAAHGYLCVSIDLPCHGKQILDGDASGLSGWGRRALKKQDFVIESNRRLSQILDHLIETGRADPARIAACGTSRGGFIALHFAAHDERVDCVAAFAPVTELTALSEFRTLQDNPLAIQLGIKRQADRLAGRPVWVCIGDQDLRVGTQHAIAFAESLGAASVAGKLPDRTVLDVRPEPRGHTTPAGAAERAAAWIRRQLPPLAHATDDRTILFVDDHAVLYRSGTRRVLHPAVAHPKNPVIREDRAWEMAIGWTSVYRDPETGKYQLWYQAYGGGRDARKSHKCVVCYAVSDDGIKFRKPDLPIHDFATDRKPWERRFEKTNIVLLGDGGYGDRYANSVLCEPDESDPARRYKMLYTDFGPDQDGREWPGFFAAFSPDGIHWTKSPRNPLNRTAYGGRSLQPPFADENPYSERWDARKNFLRKTWPLPLSMSDAVDVFRDPVHQNYVAYGKCWIQSPDGGLAWKHAMARVESTNFLDWTKPLIVSGPDEFDPPNTEFHTSPVFYYHGIYFCLNQILSARGEAVGAKADRMHIELMTSRDGFRWERPFRSTHFIDSRRQNFSNGGIFTCSTPVILDDEIRFYYGGYTSGAAGGGAGLESGSQQSGVGFASIRLDRFAGIRPVELSAQSTLKRPLKNIGQITLKPMNLSRLQSLTLNADATKGTIRPEVLTADGYRLRGFSRDGAVPIAGDSLHHPVRWRKQSVRDLPDGEYMLRLHLNNAEVFALTVSQESRNEP